MLYQTEILENKRLVCYAMKAIFYSIPIKKKAKSQKVMAIAHTQTQFVLVHTQQQDQNSASNEQESFSCLKIVSVLLPVTSLNLSASTHI